MSETTNKTDEKRVPFTVKVDEPFEFEPIAGSKFMTSTKLCQKISQVLKLVFADYEGCIFELTQGGEPTVALLFNHNDHSGSNLTCACERLGSKQVGNTIIDRGRARDSFIRNGDRFFLTDDGQDFVKSVIIRRMYNNGKPNYRDIVSEVYDRGPMTQQFTNNVTQFTKVSFISLDRLCSYCFPKEKNGDVYEYTISVSAPINTGYGSANYVLNVTQISSKELAEFCNEIGINMQSLNIIR
jgi:hypothetical protein